MTLGYNQTNITNFYLDIPDANITKAFRYNVQSSMIPGIRIPVTQTPSDKFGLGRASLPGSTIEFDPLVCRVLIDENMEAWTDIYKWMISINNYMKLESEGWVEGVLPKFITLHILDNQKKDIVMSIHYYGAFPSSLGEVEFTYLEDTDPAVSTVVTFDYKYYIIERNGVIIDSRESIKDKGNLNLKGGQLIVK